MVHTLKRISSKINEYMYDGEIPIHYYEASKTFDQNSVVFFTCISGDEQTEYKNLTEADKKEYVSNSAYISIPIISVDKLYELYNIGYSYEYSSTMNMIKEVVEVDSKNEKMLFALFLILHEFGHWNDFKSKNKKPYFYTQDEKLQKEAYDYKVQILKNQSYRMSKHKIMEQLRSYSNRHNSIPCEKMANEYAVSKIKNVYDFYTKKYGSV